MKIKVPLPGEKWVNTIETGSSFTVTSVNNYGGSIVYDIYYKPLLGCWTFEDIGISTVLEWYTFNHEN